jgi:methyltransferase-like protein
LDFVTNRMFRESLLIHAERAPQIRYDPAPTRFRSFQFAAWLPPVNGPTQLDNSRQEYVQSDGATLFTNDIGIKATLDALSDRWPWTLSRDELVDAVQTRLRSAGLTPNETLPDVVDSLMGALIMQGQVQYRLEAVQPDTGKPEPLQIEETVRRMAELTAGLPEATTFNRWHETLELSPLDRRLLPLLDGTRDNAALAQGLLAGLRADPIEVDGRQLTDQEELAAVVTEYVDTLPERLTEMKLVRFQ